LAINAVCPYYTMYPIDFPLSVLRRGSREGWVLDPFCGRGTTLLAARALGMPAVGIDSSPVAAAVAAGKLAKASPEEVIACARELLSSTSPAPDPPAGEFWEWAFHPETLGQVCRLRRAFLGRCESAPEIALRAIVLGALHGPQPKRSHSY